MILKLIGLIAVLTILLIMHVTLGFEWMLVSLFIIIFVLTILSHTKCRDYDFDKIFEDFINNRKK